MAKTKSYYSKILGIIKKEYPDMPHKEVQVFASRINKLAGSKKEKPVDFVRFVTNFIDSETKQSKTTIIR